MQTFSAYWPFVRVIQRSPVNYRHKGQWGGTLMFSLICVWINGWVNNRKAGDLRRYRAHYGVIVMCIRLERLVPESDMHVDETAFFHMSRMFCPRCRTSGQSIGQAFWFTVTLIALGKWWCTIETTCYVHTSAIPPSFMLSNPIYTAILRP